MRMPRIPRSGREGRVMGRRRLQTIGDTQARNLTARLVILLRLALEVWQTLAGMEREFRRSVRESILSRWITIARRDEIGQLADEFNRRLVSLNEVGGDPDRFGTSIEEFYAAKFSTGHTATSSRARPSARKPRRMGPPWRSPRSFPPSRWRCARANRSPGPRKEVSNGHAPPRLLLPHPPAIRARRCRLDSAWPDTARAAGCVLAEPPGGSHVRME